MKLLATGRRKQASLMTWIEVSIGPLTFWVNVKKKIFHFSPLKIRLPKQFKGKLGKGKN